jgi:2-succinyl-5-enolpyruvyl-6-hydroxy-3-cyclohexene-1-carboxylate synthase
MNQNKTGIRHLAELCQLKGIENIIISPGSRNAPIILAFQKEEGINCLSITDERSAGFFALGMAQQSGKPVALACTSGSAVLNYAPAIAEAYYQKIPLLIISADRPNEWIDQADSQTIKQKDVFKNYIRKSIELPQTICSDDDIWYTDRLINEAIQACTHPCNGPVHINIPFTEPLYEGYDEKLPEPKIIDTIIPDKLINLEDVKQLTSQWNSATKKLILTGILPKDQALNNILSELAKDSSLVVLTETTSNLFDNNFHPCIDKIISTISVDEVEDFKPELLITFGNQIISKKIKTFLRKNRPMMHWHIDPTDNFLDTYQSLTQNIPLRPLVFFEQIKNQLKVTKSNYASIWNQKEKACNQRHHEFIETCPYSDLQVFDFLLDQIPQDSHLQLANSTPVRYVQLFENRKDLHYFSNRGTSGIDGSISTAAGASYESKQLTTLITGDLSFFYDSNGLWNNYISKNLKIIIINNGGGGIFRFIDGPAETSSLNYFEAPHNLNAEHITKTFGLDYFKATDLNELKAVITDFYSSELNNAAILEIFTPREKNAEVLKDYFQNLKR